MTQLPIETIERELSREELMVRAYGEVIPWQEAKRMLHTTVDNLKQLVNAGVLKDACEGTRVDVRSIARYIERPRLPKKRWKI